MISSFRVALQRARLHCKNQFKSYLNRKKVEKGKISKTRFHFDLVEFICETFEPEFLPLEDGFSPSVNKPDNSKLKIPLEAAIPLAYKFGQFIDPLRILKQCCPNDRILLPQEAPGSYDSQQPKSNLSQRLSKKNDSLFFGKIMGCNPQDRRAEIFTLQTIIDTMSSKDEANIIK